VFTDAKGNTYTGVTCDVTQPCTTQAVDPNFRQPYSVQWNLDIQRAITNNLTLDLAYVGVHGVHEATWSDINQSALGAGWTPAAVSACLASASDAAPYDNCASDTTAEVGPNSSKFPYLNQIVQLGNQDFSHYNGLQVTVNERTSHRLSFIAGYTYSHALDIVFDGGTDGAPYPIDARNVRLSYGNSDFDIRHRFTFSPTYLIPGMKSPGQLLQGWSVSGIITLQGGLPWFPDDGVNDLLGTGEFAGTISAGVQTWNYSGPRSAFTSGPTAIPCFTSLDPKGNPILPGCTPYVGGLPPAACVTTAQAPYAGNAQLMQLAAASLANLGCYVRGGGVLTPPAFGTVGNASRNIFRSPKYYNVDLSIAKEWKFKERLTAQLRVEFFNLFNRADFSIPDSTGSGGVDPNSGSGGNFGCSCTTADVFGNNPVLGSGGPRHIQFGLKLLF